MKNHHQIHPEEKDVSQTLEKLAQQETLKERLQGKLTEEEEESEPEPESEPPVGVALMVVKVEEPLGTEPPVA